MKDESDSIIYVGKSVNLRNRVRQYFQDSSKKEVKTKTMVARIKSFEYIVTDTEIEALILENNFIKNNKPRYNILLKDDKTYPYIRISINETYPRVYKVRSLKKDNAKYYGPYTSGLVIRETLELIHKLWPLRTCHKKFPRDLNKSRTCLNYHIGKCKGPCNMLISEEEYGTMVVEVIKFLDGNHESLVKNFTKEMQEASNNLEFEKAAELRDKIEWIKSLSDKQKIDAAGHLDQDIIAFARAYNEALVQVFFVRAGKMVGREHFMLNGVDSMSRNEIITAFVQQFYSETTFIPKEIVVETEILGKSVITKWLSNLRGSNVNILVPQRGSKLKLVQLAAKNAVITLEQFGEQIKREKQRTEGAILEIQKKLGLDIRLDRIEAYDISNTQGYESVGSMVVFENGKAKRSDYRKFKIKGVLGPNDYASIEEVLYRRFKRYKKEKKEQELNNTLDLKFIKLPDIIFIDGGKGQVSAAKNILKDLNIDIPVCGMVKDDKHRTRGLLYNGEEIEFLNKSEGFMLITRIQDEVHRFAIEYHRKLRSKESIKSILDNIEGIGPTRKMALLKKFGSIEKIANAEVDELLEVDGINMNSAQSVYRFFKTRI